MRLAVAQRALHTRGRGKSNMTYRLLVPGAVGALLCLTTATVTGQTSSTMSAEQGWASISRCAQEDSERGRHACLDRVLRDAGLLTAEMHARQQRRAFGLDESASRVTASTGVGTGAASASSRASQEALNRRAAESAPAAPAAGAANTAAPAQGDRLEVELTKVEKAADGRIFVTTTDGAVWLQNETVDMPQPPVAGDHMTIRKGSLGGYRCSIVSTKLTYRCIRNR